MESVALALQPYKETIGQTGAIVTVLHFLGGVFAIADIARRRTTDGDTVVPFLGGAAFSLLNIKFGQMLQDDATIRVNFIGLALNIVYVCAFYCYTAPARKTSVWSGIGLTGAFTVGILSYVQYEDPQVVDFRFGLLLTAIHWTLVGMPLLGLGTILKQKTTEGLPLLAICSGTLVSIAWLLYGVVLRNNFMVLQNFFALALCAVQLSLFVIFPSKPTDIRKKTT